MHIKIERAIKTTTGYLIDINMYEYANSSVTYFETSIQTDLHFKIERMFRISSYSDKIPSLEEIEEIIKKQRVTVLFKSNEFLSKLTKNNFTYVFHDYYKLNEQGNALELLEKKELEVIQNQYEQYKNEETKRIAERRKEIEKELQNDGFSDPFKNEVFV